MKKQEPLGSGHTTPWGVIKTYMEITALWVKQELINTLTRKWAKYNYCNREMHGLKRPRVRRFDLVREVGKGLPQEVALDLKSEASVGRRWGRKLLPGRGSSRNMSPVMGKRVAGVKDQ